jgi:adenylosuccinate synthase
MTTNVKVVIGASAGDEGKGGVTDYFAAQSFMNKRRCLNVLTNGGSQRGHTVTLSGSGMSHVFHHFGAGTFAGAKTYLPSYFIVNPMNFAKEYAELSTIGVKCCPILVNEDCPLTTPFDMIANMMIEESRGSNRHGSCGCGIWETILRNGITVGEFAAKSQEEKKRYLEFVRDDYFRRRISSKGISGHTKWDDIIYSPNLIQNYIYDFNLLINNSIFTDDSILGVYDDIIFENGQGLLLDQNIKGYGKNTTPSNTGLQNPAQMIRNNLPDDIDVEVVYVSRTYLTRHGVGRFDMECEPGKISHYITADKTNIWNEWQGDLRYGILDREDLESRVLKDFTNYGDYEWRMSFFFTHYNENNSICLDSIVNNYNTYISDGKTRNDVKSWQL